MLENMLLEMNYANVMIVITAILLSFVSVLFLVRHQRKVLALQGQLVKLQHDLRVAHSSSIGMGQQLIYLEKQVQQQALNSREVSARSIASEKVAEKVTQKAKQPISIDKSPIHSSEPSVYDRARDSLSKGLSVADVAQECGLSYAEVSLLHSLNQHSMGSAL